MFNSDLNNALTRANSSLIAGYAMPSDIYDKLTLGASDAEYTAPANGYFVFAKTATAAGQYIGLVCSSNGLYTLIRATGSTGISCFLPVKKGDKIFAGYSAAGSLIQFRFIYAQGSESEANNV